MVIRKDVINIVEELGALQRNGTRAKIFIYELACGHKVRRRPCDIGGVGGSRMQRKRVTCEWCMDEAGLGGA